MINEFLDAVQITSRLIEDLKNSIDVKVAVSYIKESGVNIFSNIPSEIRNKVVVITSLDFGITDKIALERLTEMGVKVRLMKETGLHSKLWVIKTTNKDNILYIGSSNASQGGFSNNYEANIRTNNLDIYNSSAVFIEHLLNDDITSEISNFNLDSYKNNVFPIGKINLKHDASVKKYDFPWFRRISNKTFLSQGIFANLSNASTDKNLFINILETKNTVKIIFLQYDKTNNLKEYKIVLGTANRLPSNIQIGAGRPETFEWIEAIWSFPSDESKRFYKYGDWDDWFENSTYRYEDIKYDIFVDLYSMPNITIYVKPENARIGRSF